MSPVAVTRDTPVADTGGRAAVRTPVDLNRATPRELDGLPGIGPVLAARIVEYRQRRGGFRSVSELRSVSGIGGKKYLALKGLVIAGPVGVGVDSGR
ncbi:helix-hairpin-helix domain-containing protein [candidate division WOR-3 bacterium]|nr:helix-hairpin-helix domain-containing protein [candidate division WOR-3 bacterium]